jgi:hypothetical protein
MATKTTYQSDQSFSDDIHWRLAMTQIYEPLGWSAVRMKPEQARLLDVSEGIDYVFLNDRGQITTVQERFREVKYQEYTDFTIRYRRDQSTKNDQHESEFCLWHRRWLQNSCAVQRFCKICSYRLEVYTNQNRLRPNTD